MTSERDSDLDAAGNPPAKDAAASLQPGDAVGQYRLWRHLGSGGMGDVYEVEHQGLHRRYALKVLPLEFTLQPTAVERFRREAEVMAKLDHPHIVRVDDFGETGGRYWLRMELAEGIAAEELGFQASEWGDAQVVRQPKRLVSLADLAEVYKGKIPQRLLLHLLKQIVAGLEYAHRRGVIHQDLKPSNVLLQVAAHAARVSAGGRDPLTISREKQVCAKIGDFGLVRLVGEAWARRRPAADARRAGPTPASAGSYEYLSPEQLRGEPADARSDLYALGVMTFKLLTGRALGVKRPSETDETLAPGWDALTAAATEAEPGRRLNACADFQRLLDAVEREIEAPSATAPGGRHRPSAPAAGGDALFPRWYPAAFKVIVFGGLLGVVAVAGWMGWRQHRRTPVTPPAERREQLAELAPARSEAELRWPRVKDFERGQQMGALLDETMMTLAAAQTLYGERQYDLALTKYRAVSEACLRLEELDAERRRAAAAREAAGKAQAAGEKIGAAREDPDFWTGARAVQTAAAQAFEQGRFTEAETLWREAADTFAKATGGRRSARDKKPKDPKLPAWRQSLNSAAEALAAAGQLTPTDATGEGVVRDGLAAVAAVEESPEYQRLTPGEKAEVAGVKQGLLNWAGVWRRKTGQIMAVSLGQGVKMELVWMAPGEFTMGSPAAEAGREHSEDPQHRVKIGQGFWIGRYEVTQEQWERVMGQNPSAFKGARRPVERVSWTDCHEFLRRLNALVQPPGVETPAAAVSASDLQNPKSKVQNGTFRLPTEAEWEYACRAGSAKKYHAGETEADLARVGWYGENSGDTTHEVGSKAPNVWGLYDMHGNVWEWCEDVWHVGYDGAPADGSAWLTRGDDRTRLSRGGSWLDAAKTCRSAARYGNDPASGGYILGLRVVKTE